MRRVFMIFFALFISIAFVSTVFAQAKPEAKPAAEKPAAAPEKVPVKAEKPVAPEKAAPEKPAVPEKPKPKPKPKGIFSGEVYSVNDKTKTVTVTSKEGTPGEKGSVTFDLSNAKFKGYSKVENIVIGDKVSVKPTKDGLVLTKIAGKVSQKAMKK